MLERTPQAFMNACFSLLWNSGYSTSINDNLDSWVDYYLEANPNGVINSAVNPAIHDLHPDNSFWLAVYKRGTREIVACIAHRMIETDNFLEYQRSQKLWFGERADKLPPLDLAQPADAYPDAKGLIAYPAGLLVLPSERRSGLAWILIRIARAYALMRWPHLSWGCGNSLEGTAARGLPFNTYGYTRCDLLVDGWFEDTKQSQKVFMTSVSREQITLQIAGDLSLIEMHAKQQVGDVVKAVRERQGHAPVITAMAG